MGKQYRDEIAMVCHDIMKDAYSVGGVSDVEMKEFESDCFVEESQPSFETNPVINPVPAYAAPRK